MATRPRAAGCRPETAMELQIRSGFRGCREGARQPGPPRPLGPGRAQHRLPDDALHRAVQEQAPRPPGSLGFRRRLVTRVGFRCNRVRDTSRRLQFQLNYRRRSPAYGFRSCRRHLLHRGPHRRGRGLRVRRHGRTRPPGSRPGTGRPGPPLPPAGARGGTAQVPPAPEQGVHQPEQQDYDPGIKLHPGPPGWDRRLPAPWPGRWSSSFPYPTAGSANCTSP